MEFEWDENKRKKTLFERGIDYIDAILVWDDPLKNKDLIHEMIMKSHDIKL